MSYANIEESASIAATAVPSTEGKHLSPLEQYKLLVGDIYAPPPSGPNEESLYHEIVAEERKAKVMYFVSGMCFVSRPSVTTIMAKHPLSPTCRA